MITMALRASRRHDATTMIFCDQRISSWRRGVVKAEGHAVGSVAV
jgi:hypothetical protein